MTQADRVHSTPRTDSSLSQRLSERELTPKEVLQDLFEEELHPDPEHLAEIVIRRLRDSGFEIKPVAEKSAVSFSQLADAETFLKSQGFWLAADSCDWTNIDGDDAGIYAIDGRYGTVKAWRVEIERLQDAKRRALQLADERAIESVGLRAKLAIARKALEEIAAAPPSIAGRALIALTD